MNLTAVRSVRVPLIWTTVANSEDPDWCFGPDRRISQILLDKVKGPQVYRFVIFPADSGLTQIYVGESERFERRCSCYIRATERLRASAEAATEMSAESLSAAWKEMARNPCVRIAAAIRNAEFDKGRVELQLLAFEEFEINGALMSTESMGNPYVRRLVENMAILSSDGLNVHIMNSGRDVAAKEFSQSLEANRKRYERAHATQK